MNTNQMIPGKRYRVTVEGVANERGGLRFSDAPYTGAYQSSLYARGGLR